MVKPRRNELFEFEDFRLDAQHLVLSRRRQEIPLPPKVVETLLALVDRQGEILCKDELMNIIWGDAVVEDSNLTQNLYLLRKVLKVTSTNTPLIETLHRRGYRFNGKIKVTPSKRGTETDAARKSSSIAVLPFVNLTNDDEDEYFCDGLAEELINALAKIADLKVAARTSAFSFKNKKVDTGEIGRALNVKTVLEGSVRRAGARLRIIVQLVNAKDGFCLWSERYDADMQDIFGVQDEITLAVVDALKLKLFGEEKVRVLRRGTDKPEAHEFYLQGLFFFYKRTLEDLRKAINLFEEAIQIDPTYALAYVGLSDCYLLVGVYAGTPAGESLTLAEVAATRAVETDDSLAEAHAALGHFFFRSLNWEKAEREITLAIELNPSYAMAHQWYAEYFRALRKFDRAMEEVKLAQELDPLSPHFDTFVGVAHFNLGNSEAAFKGWWRVLEMSPNFVMTHFFLTEALLKLGDGEGAIEEAKKAVELSRRGSLFLGSLGYAFGLTGKRAEALCVIEELKEKHATGVAAGFNLAQAYTELNEYGEAIS